MNSPQSQTDRLVPLVCLSAFILICGALFLFRFLGSFYFAGFVSDNLGHFRDDAVCIARGNAPYGRGFAECVAVARKAPAESVVFEYPPATGLLLGALGLAAGASPALFQMLFMAAMFMMLILIFIVAFNEAEALRARGGPDRRLAVFAASLVAALSAGPVSLVSFDLAPALLTLGALLLGLRKRPFAAGALLGLAVAFKGYALVLLPLFLFLWTRAEDKGRALGRGLAGFAGVLAAFSVAALLISPQGFLASFTYHRGRGLELNSLYAAVVVLLKNLGVVTLGNSFNHGSWNLSGPALVRVSEKLSSPLLAGGLVLATWRAWAMAEKTPPSEGQALDPALRWTLSVLAVFIVFFKVGSPQFLCWAAPFIPLLVLRRGLWPAVLLFAISGHAATAVFPHLWSSYVRGMHALPALLVLLNKLSLLFMALYLLSPASSDPDRRGGAAR